MVDMAESRELGAVIHVLAEAIGEPGQRRFRLRAMNADGDSAAIWLEKEQLSALGEAIEKVLSDEDYRHARVPLDDLEPDPVFPLTATVDFRATQLSLGTNSGARHLVIVATESADADEPGEAVSLEVDFRRSYELRAQIRDVVAAGRKPCPLCGGPMDPAGHVCVRSNGHQPH
jgi:uncharacterized repeat protein (TIGR03847 family)